MPFTNPDTHSMGGKASQAKLTPEQRRANAQRAMKIRWDRERAKKSKKAA